MRPRGVWITSRPLRKRNKGGEEMADGLKYLVVHIAWRAAGRSQFVGFLDDIGADVLGCLPVDDGELYFLPDVIIELESSKIGRDVLCPFVLCTWSVAIFTWGACFHASTLCKRLRWRVGTGRIGLRWARASKAAIRTCMPWRFEGAKF